MTTELITTTDQRIAEFELAQRRAQAFQASTLMVPEAFRGNLGDCLIAEEMAQRMGASTLQVMQNIHVIHGRPSFSAKFLIACWNASGKYDPIDYELTGSGDDYGCIATSARNSDGKIITGPRVTIGIARAEGWLGKNGSKWKTMPDLMLRYRAATMLINTTDPGLSMGMLTTEEARDITPEPTTTVTLLPSTPAPTPAAEPIPTDPITEPADPANDDALRGQWFGEGDARVWVGQVRDDANDDLYWVDVTGAIYDDALHGWSSKGSMPSYNKDMTFRAKRGSAVPATKSDRIPIDTSALDAATTEKDLIGAFKNADNGTDDPNLMDSYNANRARLAEDIPL